MSEHDSSLDRLEAAIRSGNDTIAAQLMAIGGKLDALTKAQAETDKKVAVMEAELSHDREARKHIAKANAEMFTRFRDDLDGVVDDLRAMKSEQDETRGAKRTEAGVIAAIVAGLTGLVVKFFPG